MLMTDPIIKDVVLVGGGHSHAIVLRKWGMNPLAGVRLTLVSNTTLTPYSGMLPAHVAGFYTYDETHIDLRRLARFANAQYYGDRAVGLDLENNRLLCANRPPVAFDYLSLDIGSTPATFTVPGATEYAIAVKPIAHFLDIWYRVVDEVAKQPDRPMHLAIVGGGAGGVELALNVYRRLAEVAHHPPKIHLFHRGSRLASGQNRRTSRLLYRVLQRKGIEVHLQENVTEVLPDKVICESGLTVACDRIFWVTQASATDWIAASGLATDERGFVLVGDTLQSVSHPHIFAAGDIATMRDNPRPKAGVFAVRQGNPLYENLNRILLGQPLTAYKPQERYLTLIGTGDKNAIASWGALSLYSPLFWVWKDRIDRAFMRRFEELPSMSQMEERPSRSLVKEKPTMYCAGCGSKVGSTVLRRVLQRLRVPGNEDLVVGLDAPDDGAILRVQGDRFLVQTIDRFPSPLNDPYLFGQIAVRHCTSDIYAMGGTPHSVLATVTIPHANAEKSEEMLYQVLAGSIHALESEQIALSGGHSSEGNELALGFACLGWVDPEKLQRKRGVSPGEVFILTKAIGTGTLLAADMRYRAKGIWIDEAIASMLQSNRAAAAIFHQFRATALTDVTGFGLMGHLLEMLGETPVSVELELDAIPILPGAIACLERGITSSLQPQNRHAEGAIKNPSSAACYPLLFDPQTAGGLLAAVPETEVFRCLDALSQAGYSQARAIARVIPREGFPIRLV